MAQLKLNGWTVPISECQHAVEEIGATESAVSGTVNKSRQTCKRKWTCKTKPMLYEDAVSLEGMLRSLGEYWPANSDTFSAKGLYATADNGVTVAAAKYGNGFYARAAAVNLFTTNISTGTDSGGNTTGFTGTNCTISSSSTHAWQGTKSLKAIGSAGFSSVGFTCAVLASTTYTFSVYVKGGFSGSNYQCGASVSTNGSGGGSGFLIIGGVQTDTWSRMSFSYTTGTGATLSTFSIGENVDDNATYYFDGFMLETGPTVSAWSLAYDGVNLTYDVTKHLENGAEGIGMAAWIKDPATSGVALSMLGPGASYIYLEYSATNTMRARMVSNGGTTTQCTATWSTPSTFAFWAVVVKQSPSDGSANLLLYKDGVLMNSTTGTAPTLATMTTIYIGNAAGLLQMVGMIDEIFFWPFAPSISMLLGIYGAARAAGVQPQLIASGDIIQGPPLAVIAGDVRSDLLEANMSSSWRNNLGVVSFTLWEV